MNKAAFLLPVVHAGDGRTLTRAQFLSLLNTYNCFLKDHTQLHLAYSQGGDGEVVVEGFLNISWGVRRPIRLKIQDDKQMIPFAPLNSPDPTSPVSPIGNKSPRRGGGSGGMEERKGNIARTAEKNKRLADLHRSPALEYKVGQKVLLLSRDLSFETESRKLVPRYVGPFPISRIINPSSVCLILVYEDPSHIPRLPLEARLHLRPQPSGRSPSTPPRSSTTTQSRRYWTSDLKDEATSISLTGKDTAPRLLDLPPAHPGLLRDFYAANPGRPGRTPGGVH
ncbi:ras association domain-containing protein 6 isoform 3-T3 [Spinachia spinachia]